MSVHIKKFLSLILCLTIMLTALPLTVFAGNATECFENVVESPNTSNDAYVLCEIKEKREADTKHFMMSDGSILACVYSQV